MLFKERQHIISLKIKGCATNLHIPLCSLGPSLSALASSIHAFSPLPVLLSFPLPLTPTPLRWESK